MWDALAQGCELIVATAQVLQIHKQVKRQVYLKDASSQNSKNKTVYDLAETSLASRASMVGDRSSAFSEGSAQAIVSRPQEQEVTGQRKINGVAWKELPPVERKSPTLYGQCSRNLPMGQITPSGQQV